MRRQSITLSGSASQMVQQLVKQGRYKDFSAAPQHAASNYRLSIEEVDRAARRDLAALRKARKAGNLMPWKPGL